MNDKMAEKHLSNRYKSQKGFFVGGLLYRNQYQLGHEYCTIINVR